MGLQVCVCRHVWVEVYSLGIGAKSDKIDPKYTNKYFPLKGALFCRKHTHTHTDKTDEMGDTTDFGRRSHFLIFPKTRAKTILRRPTHYYSAFSRQESDFARFLGNAIAGFQALVDEKAVIVFHQKLLGCTEGLYKFRRSAPWLRPLPPEDWRLLFSQSVHPSVALRL